MDEVWKKYFDPRVLDRLRGLRLGTNRAAAGTLVGAHRTPRSGQAIEFSEYRQYTAGDDLRQVDWKVYGRTDKFYMRQREDETTLDCHFLVDSSGSMAYASDPAAGDKLRYALRLTASLAYIAVENHDRASLTSIGATVTQRLPAGNGTGHLFAMAAAMDRIVPEADASIAEQFAAAARALPASGLIVIVSDLFDDASALLKTIRAVRHSGSAALVVQITDPAEADFPFSETTEFVALENELAMTADARGIAAAYREEFKRHQQTLESGCQAADVPFWRVSTAEPLHARLPHLVATLTIR